MLWSISHASRLSCPKTRELGICQSLAKEKLNSQTLQSACTLGRSFLVAWGRPLKGSHWCRPLEAKEHSRQGRKAIHRLVKSLGGTLCGAPPASTSDTTPSLYSKSSQRGKCICQQVNTDSQVIWGDCLYFSEDHLQSGEL